MKLGSVLNGWSLMLLVLGPVAYPVPVVGHQLSTRPSGRRISDNGPQSGFNGVVTGHVRFEDGRAASGISVRAGSRMHRTGYRGGGEAVTDRDGRYEIDGLSADQFSVLIWQNPGPYIVPPPRDADLRQVNTIDGIDFVLRPGPHVTVHVVDAETHRPVPGLAFGPAQSTASAPSLGITDSRGRATVQIGNLEFDLSLTDPQKRGYGPAPGYWFSRHFKFEKVRSVVWDVLAYEDAYEARPAVFRGIAVDTSGHPVSGATIRLERYGTQITRSDRFGRFSFPSTRMQGAQASDQGMVILAAKGRISGASVPSVAESWNVIRVVLGSKQAEVRGIVTTPDGVPAGNCRINYYGVFGEGVQVLFNTTSTDSQGRFAITDIPPAGQYKFTFGGPSDNQAFGLVCVPPGLESRTLITLSPQQHMDLGRLVVPKADQRIEGVILDDRGRAIDLPILLELEGRTTSQSAYPDATGHFTFSNVVAEPLTLRVFVGQRGPGTTMFFRNGRESPDLLLTQSVRSGDRDLRLTVRTHRPLP